VYAHKTQHDSSNSSEVSDGETLKSINKRHETRGHITHQDSELRYKVSKKYTDRLFSKEDVDVQEADEMTNTTQHAMSPLEILKTLKDRVEQKNPIAIEGQSWSDFENERLQQLTRMVRPGQNVLMFMDKEESKFDHYALEEYVFVMRDKIPKYEEMGYKIVAE
jgi:hypothetical protein